MKVPPEQIHLYGCAAVEPSRKGGAVRVTGLVEKPSREDAPSHYAVHGVVFRGLRYDTDAKADHLRTVVRPACDRADLGPEFVAWLKEFMAGMEDAGAERNRLAA